MPFFRLALGLLSFKFTLSTAVWDYPYDAEEWSSESGASTCKSGKNQSPIDFHKSEDHQEHAFELNCDSCGTDWTVRGSYAKGGRGLTFDYPGTGQQLILNDGSKYELQTFVFHVKAEHTIDGKQASAEVQFMYAPEDSNKKTIIVGVLLKVWDLEGDEPASVTALDKLLTFDKDDSEWVANGQKTITSDFNPSDLIHAVSETKDYWTYDGSKTVPPCTEDVSWHIMMETLYLKQTQLDAITDLYGAGVDNYRPVQELNDREVGPKHAPVSTIAVPIVFAAFSGCFCILLIFVPYLMPDEDDDEKEDDVKPKSANFAATSSTKDSYDHEL